MAVFLVAECGMAEPSRGDGGATAALGSTTQSYRLGPHDALRIEVFDEKELTTETEVNGEGKIRFPLLGELHVGGLTVIDVEESLSARLKAGYPVSPRLTVSIIR